MVFESVFTAGGLSIVNILLCTLVSLALGLIISLVYMFRSTYSKSFAVALVLLPTLVQMVILMVNGNLGTSVAVLGAFSLVRFRSVPGSAREIVAIFFAMAVGLAAGSGYLTLAVVMTVIVGAVLLLLNNTPFAEQPSCARDLRVTIPENLDYTEIFDDLFQKYTRKASLESVKTTNLGSMFELRYHIVLRDLKKEKEMIDELRCRNGNLTIVCGKRIPPKEEL